MMKKRHICIGLIGLAMVSLAGCDDTRISEATEPQVTESEISETTESQVTELETYGINKAPVEDSTDSEYEISDMLPRPSDDTFIMTVEEAEAFMNKNANKDTDAEVEELDESEE